MKKKILSAVLAFCMVFGSAAALPEGVFTQSTGITASAEGDMKTEGFYNYQILDDGTVEITSYEGIEKEVTTPKTIAGKKVTRIHSNAFKNANLTETLNISEGVTAFYNHGYGFKNYIYSKYLKKVTIPKTMEEVPRFGGSDKGAVNIEVVVLAEGVKSLCEDAFSGCTKLTRINLPSTVKTLGKRCFKDCSSLKKVIVPNGITVIDQGVFSESGVETVILPSTVKKIGSSAFESTTSLKSITIPANCNDLGWFCFQGSGLKELNIEPSTEAISFEGYTFKECDNLTEVFIPAAGVKYNKYNLPFNGCDNLKKIEYDNDPSVTIAAAIFPNCPRIDYVFIPENVTTIHADAFPKTAVIYCYKGSIAEAYAVKNNLKYVILEKKDISKCTVSVNPAFFVYSGNAKEPNVTVKSGSTTLRPYKDYTVKYTNNVNAGTATVTVTGKGYYNGTITKTFPIVAAPLSSASIADLPDKLYTGKAIKPAVRVKFEGKTLKADKDYTVTYKNNTKVGTATVTITGKGNFSGTVTKTFNITEPVRLAGANRYDSAAVISQNMYKTSDTVIVATGLTFNDALVAVPLASAYNVPLLLATEKHITAQTEAELKRLGAKNVIVVSTNGAIGDKAKAEFKAAKYNMTYIEGKTCFETAAKVAKALQAKTKKAPTTIFFATDSAFADALSASPVAAIKNAPIMYLKNTGSIDSATANYLKSVKGKVKNAYIIGGDGVISDAMMKNVANALGLTVNKTVVRVAGKNRYETCVAVNNKFKSTLSGDGICVAKGLDFPDALAGGVYAAATKQALFLADGKKLQDCQNTYLKSKNASKITVFGGTGAVPDELVKTIAQASV